MFGVKSVIVDRRVWCVQCHVMQSFVQNWIPKAMEKDFNDYHFRMHTFT